LGIDYADCRARFRIHHQWTFSTERKFMGTLGQAAGKPGPILHIKGAPEIVLARCGTVLTANGPGPLSTHKAAIESHLKEYQARGMRTLGFAYHDAPPAGDGPDLDRLANCMTWLGYVAIADPVRPEVPAAMEACLRAGVSVKMVTGDTSATAREIARQIGLWQETDGELEHSTGPDFMHLSEDDARKRVMEIKVLSRARPLDKLRLVRLLKENRQVVAVTGDGTNDAPALNYADVGLAMGKTGTAVAKEASDIILLDDSFQSIVNAIMWGRSLYQNIQRFVLFQLTINVGALGIALLGPYLGVDTPLTVMQMLWINLIMDTFAALALATEPPQWSVMDRPPRRPEDFIVTRAMAWNILGTGITVMLFLLGLLLYFARGGKVTDHEESIFFTTFVLLQFWNMFNARAWGINRSAFSGLRQNRAFLAIAAAILLGQFLIVTFGGETFRTEPLTLGEWIAILFATSVILIVGEVRRALTRRGTD
jgi:Ca2+-transporting ATPase